MPDTTTTAQRIKSYRMRHDWQITGSEPLPEDHAYTLTRATCPRCGETTDFTAPIDEFTVLRAWGCARDGFTGRYESEDLVRVGNRLDYFLNYLPDGKCATSNLGGGSYAEDVANLVPVLANPTTPRSPAKRQMPDHECPRYRWPWRRLEVRQCPDCGTWWKAEPVSLTRAGGWYRATRLGVWWARRRGRIASPAA